MPLDKTTLRRRFQSYRASLGETAYRTKSDAVVALAAELPELRAARTVHVYWPMTERREVDTRPLIRRLHHQGKQIVLPVVLTFSRQAGTEPRMRHVRFPGVEALEANPWGIREPAAGEPVPVDAIDAVVVPALGAGRDGHRIGHGYGYYDEFLAAVDGPCICLTYDACLVDAVPAEPHDVPMTAIVTEREVLRPLSPVTSGLERRRTKPTEPENDPNA